MYRFLTGNKHQVIEDIVFLCKKKRTSSVSFLPVSLNDLAFAKKKPHAINYSRIDYFLPDGMPLVWWLTLIRKKPTDRIYGPSLMVTLLKHKDSAQLKHYFICPNEFSRKKITKTLTAKFKRLNKPTITSLSTARIDNLQKIHREINIAKPDIVWIGVGSPKQVEIAAQLKKKHMNLAIFCVGAAFEFLTGQQKQAPPHIQHTGLEWAFRLLTEPQRLWKRYLVHIPSYLLRETGELFLKILKNK